MLYYRQRLSKIDTNESTGCLYGLMYDGTLLVVGLSLELFESERNTYNQLLLNLPTEIELCGVIKFGETLTTETRLKEILQVSCLIFRLNVNFILLCVCSLTLGWASWQFKRICILNFKCSVNSPNRPKFLKKYFLNSSILRNENKYMGHLIAVITAATAHKYNYSSRVCSWVFMKVEALFWKTPMS